MTIASALIEKGCEVAWHYLKVPERFRELRDRRRLLSVMPELRALTDALSYQLHTVDTHFNFPSDDSFLALIFSVALARSQMTADRYFPGSKVVVSLKTLDTDPAMLRCWYGLNVPEHRFGGQNEVKRIPIEGTAAGNAYKNNTPCFISDFGKINFYSREYYEKFRKFIGSLVTWPIECRGRGVLGVLKVDSPYKRVFSDNPPTRALVEQLVANFCLVFSLHSQFAFRSENAKEASKEAPKLEHKEL